MNAEWTPELRARAQVHAALGEPARLAIVDRLVLGDASPTELGQYLGLPSNLLAHHLKLLEQAGVVERSRSEGDRRRTYLRLRPAALAGLQPAGRLAAPRVVFVCTHNSARSQLAAAMWNDHSPVPATSAGTHPAPRVHPGAVAVARRRNLALVPAPPRHVRDVLDPADLVVTVCDSAHEELATGSMGVAVGRPGLHWSIPDPVTADDPAAFDNVVDELTDRITRLTPAVHAVPEPKDQERSS